MQYKNNKYQQNACFSPVRVVEDDSVGGLQVDTQASCTGTQHENELVTIGPVEISDAILTVLFVNDTPTI